MVMKWKTAMATASCVAMFALSALAQVAPPTILKIDTDNGVRYVYDTADLSTFATVPTPLIQVRPTFATQVLLSDIVAVNGKPAKGVFLTRQTILNLTTDPTAGQAIADVVRTNVVERILEILQPDGTPIGSLMTLGFDGGSPPPGAPLIASGFTSYVAMMSKPCGSKPRYEAIARPSRPTPTSTTRQRRFRPRICCSSSARRGTE